MNKNITLGIIAIAMFSVMMLSMVGAAVTLTSPTASSYNSGTVTFTCTKAVGDAPLNATNATLYYTLATTGSGYTRIAASLNSNNTADDASFSTTGVSISGLTDGLYNFTCYLLNETNENVNSSVVQATVDNTSPTLEITETSVVATSPINYKCTDTNINTFTVSHKNAGGTTVSETLTQSVLTQYLTTVDGSYTFTCTDLASNSASEVINATVPEGYAIPPKAISQGGLNIQNALKSPIFWIVIIGLAFLLLKKK